MSSAAARIFVIMIVLSCKEKAEGIFSHFLTASKLWKDSYSAAGLWSILRCCMN